MKQVLHFLRQLKANNNREWFLAHKSDYQTAAATINRFAEELILRIGEYDPTVRGLTPKDCTYRIYRDVRFSKDKLPYKTHFGVYVCRGGKKSGYSGYYFHIGTGDADTYPAYHMLAAGDYCTDPKALKVLREDIVAGEGDFEQIIKAMEPRFHLDRDYMLQRVPKGFAADTPYADYLRYKVYTVLSPVDDNYILAPGLAQRVADDFRMTKPFLDYVNRAIEFAQEEEV